MIVDLVLFAIIVALALATVHYRAQSKATSTTSSSAVATLEAELAILRDDVRNLVDSKFKALGAWLLAEMQKSAPPALTDPVAPAASDAAPPAAAPPSADAAAQTPTTGPSATSDGTETAAHLLEMIKAKHAQLGESIPRIEAALAAKRAADAQLAKELTS